MSKRNTGSDFAKVDAHEITQEKYDELPEVTDEVIERAKRDGRIRVLKEPISIRLDWDLIDRLRKSGPGWQTRVNAALRAWADKTAI